MRVPTTWVAVALAGVLGGLALVAGFGATLGSPAALAVAVAAGGGSYYCWRVANRRLVAEVYEARGVGAADPGGERDAGDRNTYREDWHRRERQYADGGRTFEDDWDWSDRVWEDAASREEGAGDAFEGVGADGSRGRAGDHGAGRDSAAGRRHVGARTREACEVLGVDADAHPGEIRAAYRRRAKETHPDRGGDPEAFKRVRWAYEHLRARAQRREATAGPPRQ